MLRDVGLYVKKCFYLRRLIYEYISNCSYIHSDDYTLLKTVQILFR